MKKMSKADIERMQAKGSKVSRRSKPAELTVVKEKLVQLVEEPKERVETKRRFEFTVVRDANGFIQKINAQEL